MKSKRTILGILLGFSISSVALARDTIHHFPIAEPMATSTAKKFVGVRFFFGNQSHPRIKRTIGTFSTHRTTNAFLKSDKEACDWGFLSALKSLWQRAEKEGGNAIIDIHSITTGKTVNSPRNYVCRAGNVVAKVYLEGKVVVVK